MAGAEPIILNGILNLAREKQIAVNPCYEGMTENVGSVSVKFMNPPAQAELKTANENSLVLRFSFKEFSAILTGDMEKSGETAFLQHPGDLSSQLLKVAHHGSRMGTSNGFLDRIKPRWAVVSAGRHNPFGHPSRDTLTRLIHHGALPIQTSNEGAITFETDGIHYRINSYVNGILEKGKLKATKPEAWSQEPE